jgi:AcrR family transcriptional regulator
MAADVQYRTNSRNCPREASVTAQGRVTVDRRVRRTRELLRSALISMILEKGYERVTVQDIIDRADVGRSTFYAHFRDKEDLLVFGLEELRAAFQPEPQHAGGSDAKPRAASPTLAVFEHFARHREVWRAMVGKRGAEVFIRYLRRFLSELVRGQLAARAPKQETQVPLDAVVEFAVNAMIGLGVRWWLENDLPYSPAEMDQLYRRLTEPGMRAGLRPKA